MEGHDSNRNSARVVLIWDLCAFLRRELVAYIINDGLGFTDSAWLGGVPNFRGEFTGHKCPSSDPWTLTGDIR